MNTFGAPDASRTELTDPYAYLNTPAQLYCDAEGGTIWAATLGDPKVSVFDVDQGTRLSEVEPTNLFPRMYHADERGLPVFAPTTSPEGQTHQVRVMVPWGPEHLLVQYDVAFEDATAGQGNVLPPESRLIGTRSRAEEAGSSAFPRLAATSGERLYQVEGLPFPRLVVLVRR